ncbi:hypothetical protein ACRAQ6_11915 [Erythrobacter sp. HA6-11]
MLDVLSLAYSVAITLPGYALGQPMEDALLVVPVQTTRDKWVLRCADDPMAPIGLERTVEERDAGVQRCWTMEKLERGEVRRAYPMKGAYRSTQEIEFLDGKITRITITRYDSPTDANGRSSVWKKPKAAALIDSL